MLDHVEKKPPFLKLLPAFCIGITWGWYAPPQWNLGIVLLATGFFMLVLLRMKKLKTHAGRMIGMVGIQFLLTGCGSYITATQKAAKLPDEFLTKEHTQKIMAVVEVAEHPAETEKSFKYVCELQGYINPDSFSDESSDPDTVVQANELVRTNNRKIIVYIRKNGASLPAGYGSRMLIACLPQQIRSSGNPGAFDYAGWCAKKGIYLQAWADTGHLIVLPGFYGNKCLKALYEIREELLEGIDRYIPAPTTGGIAKALLVGYRHGIDDELNEAYIRTGVVHIVAISGMHLSMIFGLMAMIPFGRKSRVTWCIRNISIGILIWLFTLLTGGAASIVRAAVMLSLLLLAECLTKRSGSVNTLLAAAFLMLAMDPMTLWDIGFQLSFTAVAGLILFAKRISTLVEPKHPLLRLGWQMQAVNIAAQVLTTPLVLFYFHQFPLLFLLTNMVAVPVSGMVLYMEILFCLFLWYAPVAMALGKIIHHSLAYMNNYIEAIATIPFCTAENLRVSMVQMVWMYLLIIWFVSWVNSKKVTALRRMLFALLAIFMLRDKDTFFAERQAGLYVYQLPDHFYAEGIKGRMATHIHIGGNNFLPDEKAYKRYILPAHIANSISERDATDVYVLKGKLPVYIMGWAKFKTMQQTISSDMGKVFVVLVENAVPEDDLKFHPTMIVLSNNINSYHSMNWKKYCRKNQVACYDMKQEGAFVIPLN
ncbi:MAG: ComEC/Rec2 family competence protein [Chitinophagaceae bacterium]